MFLVVFTGVSTPPLRPLPYSHLSLFPFSPSVFRTIFGVAPSATFKKGSEFLMALPWQHSHGSMAHFLSPLLSPSCDLVNFLPFVSSGPKNKVLKWLKLCNPNWTVNDLEHPEIGNLKIYSNFSFRGLKKNSKNHVNLEKGLNFFLFSLMLLHLVLCILPFWTLRYMQGTAPKVFYLSP